MSYEHIVIGKGLIGSAAAKYLALQSESVLLIGPEEPTDFATSNMFASHYDQARVQRVINFSPMWTRMSVESVAAWPELEKQTGIQFHGTSGCIYLAHEIDTYLSNVSDQANEFVLEFKEIKNSADVSKFAPEMHFEDEVVGIFEGSPSGTINPRLLVLAQLAAAQQFGCEVKLDTAIAVERDQDSWLVRTADGSKFVTRNVIVAGGSFSNFNSLLPVTLDTVIKSEVVILAEVSESNAQSLSKLPSLLYEVETLEFDGIYLMHPVQYPDGKWYLKMGMNQREDLFFDSLAQVIAWFQGDEHKKYLPKLQQELTKIFPGIEFLSFQTKPCVISRTVTANPYISAVAEGLFVATGCNGYSAMTSDAQGRIVASLALTGDFPTGYDAEDFRVVTK